MYTRTEGGEQSELITIVDDLLVSEPGTGREAEEPELLATAPPVAAQLIAYLEKTYKCKLARDYDPTSFAGYGLRRDWAKGTITMDMKAKIEEYISKEAPHIADVEKRKVAPMLSGRKLSKALEQLEMPPKAERPKQFTVRQGKVRSHTGFLKWINKVKPGLSKHIHCLSCVIGCPPAEATAATEGLMAWAYDTREHGITFGGVLDARLNVAAAHMTTNLDIAAGAPNESIMAADATWNDAPVYGLLLTAWGATVLAVTKKLHLQFDSSAETEAVASGKGGEITTYFREVMRAMGEEPPATLMLSDNKANAAVVAGTATPTRLRHCLRRYTVLMQRVARGDVRITHVRDPDNPSDFLTKFVKGEKFQASDEWACNYRNEVPWKG